MSCCVSCVVSGKKGLRMRDSMRKLTGNYWSVKFCVVLVLVAVESVKWVAGLRGWEAGFR